MRKAIKITIIIILITFILNIRINDVKGNSDSILEFSVRTENSSGNDNLTMTEFNESFIQYGEFELYASKIDVYAKSVSGDINLGVLIMEFDYNDDELTIIPNDILELYEFESPFLVGQVITGFTKHPLTGVETPKYENIWEKEPLLIFNRGNNELNLTGNQNLATTFGGSYITINDSEEVLLFSFYVIKKYDNLIELMSPPTFEMNSFILDIDIVSLGEDGNITYDPSAQIVNSLKVGDVGVDPTADITGIDITGSNSYNNKMSNTNDKAYETDNDVSYHHANEGINLNPLFVSPSATITSFMLGEADLSSLISTDGKSIENLQLNETKTYTMVVEDDDDKEETYTLTINVEDPDDEDGITFTTNQSSENHIGFGEGVDSNNYYIEVPYSVATIEVTGHKTSTSPYTNIDGKTS